MSYHCLHRHLPVITILIIIAVIFIYKIPANAQTVLGTKGLMNIPTADMNPAGTFDGGASFVQKELLYDKSYNTGIYYITFTPFSWMEITYRETLLKTRKSAAEPDKIGFYQQDRSTTLRLRPLKEGRWWPAVVFGANDIYSDHGDSKYANIYGVATKHFPIRSIGTFAATAGYSYARKSGTTYDGFMGGLSFSPEFCPELRVMGDYDTRGINVGMSAFLFRHLNLTCFTHKFKGVNATVSYQYTIRY